MSENKKLEEKIPDGYKIIGTYRRNGNYVYLKKVGQGRNEGVAIPFSFNDISFNFNFLGDKNEL